SSSTVWPINPAKSAPTPTVTATDQSALNASTCIGRSTLVQLCVCNKPKVTVSKTLKSTLLVVTTSTWTRRNHSAGMVQPGPEENDAQVAPPGCHLYPLTMPVTIVAISASVIMRSVQSARSTASEVQSYS